MKVSTTEYFQLKQKEAMLESLVDELYGKGLEVKNHHMNGELEPMDLFFEDVWPRGLVLNPPEDAASKR